SVDYAFQRLPLLASGSHPFHTTLVVQRHLIPKRPARAHAIVPGHVMEPEQKFLGTVRKRTESERYRSMVLGHCVAPGRATIESNSVDVGLVKINRIPVVSLFLVPPRGRPVMMTAPKQMMQSQRRHVIDQSFMGLKHDARDGFARSGVVSKRHRDPFTGNLRRGCVRVPGQRPKSVPVRLEKGMPSQLAIGPGVRAARHARDPLMIESSIHDFGYC